jgi:hypothetical protein
MKMLTRIATLSLGALIALSASSAEAGPPRTTTKNTVKKSAVDPAIQREHDAAWKSNPKPPAAALSQRTHPPRGISKVTTMTEPVVEEARIEKFEEGMIYYSVAIPDEVRESMAQKKGVPLSKIPERSNKSARLNYRSLTPRQVADKIGDDVVLELRQDPYGYLFVTSLSAKKRK